MVLDIKVPAIHDDLGRQLLAAWPSFAAFAVSFATIGIIWVNHHAVFDQLRAVDRWLLFLNLLLLATVVFIPFVTALVSAAFEARHGQSLATAIYGATMAAMGVSFNLIWLYLERHRSLLEEPLRTRGAAGVMLRAGVGTVIYLATIVIAFINAYVCLALYAALALFYVFDVGAVTTGRG